MTIAQLQRAKEIENRLVSLAQSKNNFLHLSARGISSMNITARGGVGCNLDLTLLDELAFVDHVLARVNLEIETLTKELQDL